MDASTLFIGILIIIFFVYLLRPKKRPANFPPGPPGIPLFGNALQMGSDFHRLGIKLQETYGPIIGVKNGSQWMVMLNNVEDIREAFGKPEFTSRFGYNPFKEELISSSTQGVVMSYGKNWQDIRRFSLKSLREFGFGKKSMESIIQDEVQELIDEKFRKNLGRPISTDGIFNASVLNVIWALVAGERYKLNDERLQQLLRFIIELFATSFSGAKILNFMFPAVVKFREMLPFHLPDSNKGRQKILDAFLQKTIDEHRATIQFGSPRDFIDAYLEDQIKTEGKYSKDDSRLIATLMDFFGAGSDTTSNTLSWAVFYLALHQPIQEKLFKEIQAVVGTRIVQLDDRPSLPYITAVMEEVYRLSSLAPLGVPHATSEDVIFKGFNFPKNTVVFANLYAVHHSEKTWGDPYKFRPERFLSKDEKVFTKHPNVIPFSVGKRSCPGEVLAKDEFFIFLANMIQQLKIVMPDDEPQHSLNGVRGLVLTPEPHRIIVLDRNN